nr:UPF0179 family protein [Candidatus Sigynarchaeota archaeon]
MSAHQDRKTQNDKDRNYLVTLALEQKVKINDTFVHDEIPRACSGCPLYQICMKNLVPHRRYRIIEIKEGIRHECPKKLFNGTLVVVKVQEPPLLVTFPPKNTFKGINIKY